MLEKEEGGLFLTNNGYNLTFKKLAEIVGKSPAGFENSVRGILKEWYEAGIAPKIYRGEIIEEGV